MSIEPYSATQADLLDQQMHYAERLAGANIVPDAFKRQPANILVALAIANDMGESAWTVMSEMSIISGKPSFSAKFMRARVRRAGHTIRESFKDGVARCVIIRADDPKFEHVAEWDEAKARQHNLWGKGHWLKNPSLMLSNRALSECVREACYEVMSGVGYTPDEVMDFAPEPSHTRAKAAATVADLPEPNAASKDQLHTIAKLMDARGYDKQQMLDIARDLTVRTIGSATDLTLDEADVLIAALSQPLDEDLEPDGPEILDAELLDAEGAE